MGKFYFENLKFLLFIVELLNLLLGGVFGTKCFKNEDVGDREGNIYYCDASSLPECCEENQDFTCCEETSKKALREQLILWGAVTGVIILIAVFMCWFFKDYKCCSSERTLRERCGCKKNTSDEDSLKEDGETTEHSSSYKAYRVPRTADGRPLPSDEDLKISPGSGCTNRNFNFYY